MALDNVTVTYTPEAYSRIVLSIELAKGETDSGTEVQVLTAGQDILLRMGGHTERVPFFDLIQPWIDAMESRIK